MTALDQAFIKAFAQQDTSSVAIPPQSSAPLPPSDIFDGVLAALEKPPSRPASVSKVESSHGTVGSPAGEGWSVHRPFKLAGGGNEGSGIRGQGAEITNHLSPSPEPRVPNPEPRTPNPEPRTPNPEPRTPNPEPRIPNPESFSVSCDVVNHPDSAASARRLNIDADFAAGTQRLNTNPQSPIPNSPSPPAPPEFKPAWQVDRFTWPRVCRRLMTRTAEEFDRLADALLTASLQGQKVLVIAGCRRGEGATTLLLCAARQLAKRGVKAVLVDADPVRPRLAKCLGVQPQLGWDEISEEKEECLDQAIIESTANGLALTTVGEPSAEGGLGDWPRLASCLDTLRDHYEMVLVDPGPLEDVGPVGEGLFRAAGGHVDAVLLVHNQRVTSEEQLSEVEQRLTAAGIVVAGLIENFVAL